MDLVGIVSSEPVRTLLAFVTGGLFTAVLAEWRTRAEEGRSERRARSDRIRSWRLERIQQTEVAVLRYCRVLHALAVGAPIPATDFNDLPRHDLRVAGEDGGGAMLDTFPFLGEWDSRDRMLAVSRLRVRLLDLLEAQELRALADEAINEMSEETAAKVGTRLPDLPGGHVSGDPDL